MRLYKGFSEALNELRREVAEFGIQVHSATWQDRVVKDDKGFDSLELQNYIYTVLEPDINDLRPTQPWAGLEWEEREAGIHGVAVNPGRAWRSREEIWKQFLTREARFGYTYSERFALFKQVKNVIHRLSVDPDSRQCYVSLWTPEDVTKLGGVSRVPCTLGYMFQFRDGGLNMTYLQRSADLVTHFENDIFLAFQLQRYVAAASGHKVGRYTHWIASLHAFRRDLPDVF